MYYTGSLEDTVRSLYSDLFNRLRKDTALWHEQQKEF